MWNSESRVLADRRWQTDDGVGPNGPFGLLGTREGNLLYVLARDYYRGNGVIVDAGSFLGRSAWCFARGLAANPSVAGRQERIVHCFDNFVVNDQLTVEAIRGAFNQHLPIGASTRRLFEAATAPVADWLVVHEGDFHTYDWPARPIEILLVDIAKSPSLNQRLVETMFPLLIPGRSVVVQQDYHHPWLPHLHATMEVLQEYFELIEPKADDSAAFLLHQPLPAEAITAAATVHTRPFAERLALMDAAIARLPVGSRSYVQLARAHMLGAERGYEAMRQALESVSPVSSADGEASTWPAYLAQMQGVLEDLRVGLRRGWELLSAGDAAAALTIAAAVTPDRSQYDDAQVLRAHCLRGLGRLAEAAQVIELAIGRRGTDPAIWVEKAWLAVETGDLEAAIGAARQGLGLAAASRQWQAACLDVLGDALARSGRHGEAIAAGAEAVAALPDAVWIREHHAYNLLGAGRLADAETAARDILAMAPSSAHACSVLAAIEKRASPPRS